MDHIHAQAAPQKENDSFISKVTSNPVFPLGLNVVLFIAGVAFIQSPLMDAMAPQL